MNFFASKSKPKSDLDSSMIPAINIVFLLLVFFMVAGQIKHTNHSLLLPLATSTSDRQNAKLLTITIDAEQQILLNGHQAEGHLKSILAREQLANYATVEVRVHKDLPASIMDPILLAAAQQHISQVHLITQQHKP